MQKKIILFILVICTPVFAENVDSAKVLDSATDHIIYNINYNHGKIGDANDMISFKNIQSINYINFNDIFTQTISSIPLWPGIRGNNEYFAIFGAMPNENTLMLNGVTINDLYGLTDFNQISPEYMQTAEILFGSSSVIKTGKSGVSVNIQTPLFNTKKPYTRLWYSQGDNKLIGVDGTYSQNFLPNWNITAGFRRMSANSFYPNSFFDSWNTRLALRYNINDLSTLSLLYHFTNYYAGDFGGIKFENYATDNLLNSNFDNLSNRQYNTNVILTYSKYFSDTSFILNSNIFFNHNENNILYAKEALLFIIDSIGKSITDNYKYGLNMDGKYIFSDIFGWQNTNLNIDFGWEAVYKNIPKSVISSEFNGMDYSIYGKGNLILNMLRMSVGGRVGKEFGIDVLSGGANVTANINNNVTMYIDASSLQTTPSLIFNKRNEKHQLFIVGTKLKYENINSNVNIFYRNINEPIWLQWTSNIYSFTPIYSNITQQNIYGINIDLKFKFLKKFEIKANIQDYIYNNNHNSTENTKSIHNNLNLKGTIQYTYTKGINYISGGIEMQILLNEQKLYYNPLFKHYSITNMSNGLENNGLAIFINAKLGNCFLRGSFNNLLGMDYSFLAYYPMPKQEVRLSLTFMFPTP